MKAMLKGLGKGVGGSAIEGGAGVAAFYIHRMLSTKMAFIQNHPLAAPGGMLLAGHILKKQKRLSGIGTALCGIAGYAGAQVFELQKATTAAQAPKGTSGFDDDTGALTSASDIGALTSASDIGEMYGPGPASSYGAETSGYDDADTLSNI